MTDTGSSSCCGLRNATGIAALLVAAIASICSPAGAAESASDDQQSNPAAPGSHLTVNTDLTDATSVLSISSEEARLRGDIRVEDFLNTLPQVFSDQASEVLDGATGTGTLNLRGLGAERTLVLLDGRRLPYGSSTAPSANLDLIPLPMVERVEILTGGASAVHGSDAIGGVANFVMKRNFEGAQLGGQWGTSFSDNGDDALARVLSSGSQPLPGSQFDGAEALVYVMLGANAPNDRGNLMFYAALEEREEIVRANRLFAACDLASNDGQQIIDGFTCARSANFRLFGGPGGFQFQRRDGTLEPFNGSPQQTFNAQANEFLQRPAQRYNAHLRGHYTLADQWGALNKLEAFADISYTETASDAQSAPTASFGFGSYRINCDNPLIQVNAGVPLTDTFGCTPADVSAGAVVDGITASHRNVEGGARNVRFENSAWRAIAGLRGSLAAQWHWEAFAQIADTRDERRSTNNFLVANVQQALLVTTDANGQITCTDPTGGCVPYNIFQRGPNGESLVTQQALNFIQGTGVVDGSTRQTVFGASIQANLATYGLRLPTADYGLAIVFGVESRKDTLDSQPDELSRLPDDFTTARNAVIPVSGALSTNDVFAELEVPLLSRKPAADQLTLRAQYRFSDYSASGAGASSDFSANTYGLSLSWVPIKQLQLRAQLQRAARAPNVIELFTRASTNVANLDPLRSNTGAFIFDPCATGNPIASLDVCARTGVTAAQFGNIADAINGETQALTGGNPQLTVETADTVTLGATWTPTFTNNLTLSLDYFDISIEDAVSARIPVSTILNQCLASGAPVICDLITRGPTGSLAASVPGIGFTQINSNLGSLETRGLDMRATYAVEFGKHSIHMDYTATRLETLQQTLVTGAETTESAGFFGNTVNTPSPEYRHRLVATWHTPWQVEVIATWRRFGATDNLDPQALIAPELAQVDYFDLAARWQATGATVVRGSLLNVFAEDPPIFADAVSRFANGNTYPTVYDTSTVFVASLQYSF